MLLGLTKWRMFAEWHREPSFWRELYVRSLAGIVTVSVIFGIGVISGVVSVHRDEFILAFALVGALVVFLGLLSPIVFRGARAYEERDDGMMWLMVELAVIVFVGAAILGTLILDD